MNESQVTLVQEQTWLDMRTKVAQILVENGILESRNDIVGFWKFDPTGNHQWVSLYDLLETARG